MTHAISSDARYGNLDSTSVTNNVFIFDSLIFTAGTFIVPNRTEYLLTKQTSWFWFESAVINGFRVLDLTFGPRTDDIRRGYRD
jgi:hypothetical protein